MKRLGFLTLLALVAALPLWVSTGPAVASHTPGDPILVDGDDTMPDVGGCGSVANPCNTIQAGVDHAVDDMDEVVQVATKGDGPMNGDYEEEVSVDKDITITEKPDEQPILRGSITIEEDGDGATIDGLRVHNTRTSAPSGVALLVDGAEDTTITHNEFVGVAPDAGYFVPSVVYYDEASNFTFSDNVILGINDGRGANALAVDKTAGVAEIANNEFYKAGGGGLGLTVNDPDAVVTVTGNDFDSNFDGLFTFHGMGAEFDTLQITGNAFHENRGAGLRFAGPIAGEVLVESNNIYGNAEGAIHDPADTTINVECNWWGHFSGPTGGYPFGMGDSVTAGLDFAPWHFTSTPRGEGLCDLRETKDGIGETLGGIHPTGDTKTDALLEEALKRIAESLNPAYWVDGRRLHPIKGVEVLDAEKAAVKALVKIGSPPEVEAAIQGLTDVEEALAEQAIEDATVAVASSTNESAAAALAKAEAELAKGQASEAAFAFEDACRQYGEAWKQAQKAIKEAPKP